MSSGIRETALNAALEIWRPAFAMGSPASAIKVLETAREIEAYLSGKDTPPKGGVGVNLGGPLTQVGHQQSQGLPQ